jgi:DNA-binding transcriptional ArsR family regulator
MAEIKHKDLGETLLIKMLGYSPKLRILDIFLDNPYFDFSKSEAVRELGMSKQTFYKNFKDLEELGIVKISRKIGRAVLYKINTEHPLVKKLDEIINEVSLQIARKEQGDEKSHIDEIQDHRRHDMLVEMG